MKHKVFFDASCILAALGSDNGGSFKLMRVLSESKHSIYTSEIALDEARRHLTKIKSSKRALSLLTKKFKIVIIPAPKLQEVERCYKYTKDPDDAYLIASCFLKDCSHLVSLDKKHVLPVSAEVKRPKILTPGSFLRSLSK